MHGEANVLENELDNNKMQEKMVETQPLTVDQQTAMELLQEVCAHSGQTMEPILRSIQGQYLSIDLVGPEVAGTWGRHGQALDALQFLCNLILSRKIRSDVRLMLDAAEYRQRRADLLIQRARDLAAEVRERNEEAELEPLPAHERRIIHAALLDEPDIETYSEGDEPHRHIVIAPKK